MRHVSLRDAGFFVVRDQALNDLVARDAREATPRSVAFL